MGAEAWESASIQKRTNSVLFAKPYILFATNPAQFLPKVKISSSDETVGKGNQLISIIALVN